jgi:tetratricopeptide (TPR) repeat protein
VLASLDEFAAAESHLRAAWQLLPEDQSAAYGLALCLMNLGGDARQAEADELLKAAIALNPGSAIGEAARQARTELAEKGFREATTAERPDAVMYCLGALERFAKLSRNDVQSIAFEIGMLGRSGLDVNNPDTRYHLRSLPGDFSGLQLVAMMYVGFKQIAPEMDIGFDLAKEYAMAQALHTGGLPR